mmetsp:Transcript_45386/g.145620  ORF Transcript_45386/g.145620 Transcript_45386/m.145620 type:complete len:226 (+) Transcript_45386:1016-1693(+)
MRVRALPPPLLPPPRPPRRQRGPRRWGSCGWRRGGSRRNCMRPWRRNPRWLLLTADPSNEFPRRLNLSTASSPRDVWQRGASRRRARRRGRWRSGWGPKRGAARSWSLSWPPEIGGGMRPSAASAEWRPVARAWSERGCSCALSSRRPGAWRARGASGWSRRGPRWSRRSSSPSSCARDSARSSTTGASSRNVRKPSAAVGESRPLNTTSRLPCLSWRRLACARG